MKIEWPGVEPYNLLTAGLMPQPLHYHTITHKNTKHHTKHSPYIPKSQHSVSQSSSCIVPSTVVPTEWTTALVNELINKPTNQSPLRTSSRQTVVDLFHPAEIERMYFPSATTWACVAVDHDWVHIPSRSTELSSDDPHQHHSTAANQQSALSNHKQHYNCTKDWPMTIHCIC